MDRGPIRWLVVGALVMGGGAGWAAGLSAAAPNRPHSCPHPTIPVPPGEPVYSSGPTELVTGLYIQGGALPPPPCKPEPRGPYAGTIKVMNAKTGATVVTRMVSDGHLAHIALQPGEYKLSGRIAGGASTTGTPKVTIRHGYKTRQDQFEDVP